MKKITLLAVTALTTACLFGQTLTVQAASKPQWHVLPNGGRVFFTYSSGCDIQSILDKLENCFPNISLPDCETPEENIPEVENPENNTPENNVPEINIPENNMP